MKKLFRSIAVLCLIAATMVFAVSVAATGADCWIPDAFKDYVFDAEYYAAKYPDVAKEYGTSEQALYEHFLNYGVDEKKQGSPTFSVEHYLSYNGGLKTMFGKDYRAALLHYCDNRYPETVYQSAPNKFMGDTFDAVISRAESTASGSYNIGVSDAATNAGNGQYNVEALAADSTDLKQLWTQCTGCVLKKKYKASKQLVITEFLPSLIAACTAIKVLVCRKNRFWQKR